MQKAEDHSNLADDRLEGILCCPPNIGVNCQGSEVRINVSSLFSKYAISGCQLGFVSRMRECNSQYTPMFIYGRDITCLASPVGMVFICGKVFWQQF